MDNVGTVSGLMAAIGYILSLAPVVHASRPDRPNDVDRWIDHVQTPEHDSAVDMWFWNVVPSGAPGQLTCSELVDGCCSRLVVSRPRIERRLVARPHDAGSPFNEHCLCMHV
ncbi:uncharacterized protein K489DRAFT_375071 [Dissoconium aciculare CBS 342.82]|uniref:Uncharacterized protein n=1 Tax=Dissoconium aciculare CBS 342.82 TaxID=1314786 RepID=A0A6J3MJ86_9PEZI|nr:uncharacterized protein K489DRAFT_375071 [Dissoconium aciculare CBS 342.82]KAF1826992.1 hypothetical protein K489DRAFT_375071 [Dissoconium aciculare CBS 342.82]